MKKSLILVVAALAVFAMSAVSFAANTAKISVTSEPITDNAPCDKAGGFAITFDDGTQFRGGDQITFDLDFGVTLCRDIDLEVGIQGNTNVSPHASQFTGNYTLLPKGNNTSPLTGDGSLGSNAEGVLFKIVGTTGSQRVTINILSDIDGDGTLDSSNTALLSFAGTQVTDQLELAFLDQATYTTAGGDAGIFAPDATTGDYDGTDATAAQNTLCIDVSSDSFTSTKVQANYDSKNDKYTWIPSNPQIAHIVSGTSYAFEECKGRITGYILDPSSAIQNVSATCAAIDNELDGAAGGFCNNVTADTHTTNNVIIKPASGVFASDTYQIELEILVNGQTGENGVYWTDSTILTDGYSTEADACAATNTDGGNNAGAHTYELANGDSATPVSADDDCTITDAAKAVKVTTAGGTLGLDGVDDDYLYINLPDMQKDSTVDDGDVVSVKVTLLKAPCGELFTDTWTIGTVGCTATATSNTLTYPYFAKTGSYANALVVTNLSGTSGTASITIYEADGDVFTASIAVGANTTVASLLSGLTLTQTSGIGSFGDARAYVVITTDFNADGAAMITNPATGESIGYLPRLGS